MRTAVVHPGLVAEAAWSVREAAFPFYAEEATIHSATVKIAHVSEEWPSNGSWNFICASVELESEKMAYLFGVPNYPYILAELQQAANHHTEVDIRYIIVLGDQWVIVDVTEWVD